MAADRNRNIDMICQHKADGTIIPIKIRILDDDGAYQEYRIRSFKDMSYKGKTFNMPDVADIRTSGIYPFECKVTSFGCERVLRVFYNSYEHTWKMENPRK